MKTTSSNPNRKQLIEKIINVAKECNSYNPESPVPTASDFRYKNEASLEVILKDAERSLKNAKRIAKTNEFYATDGGQMFKAAQEQKKEALEQKLRENADEFAGTITNMVKNVIGEGFTFRVESSYIVVYADADKYASFEIRYDTGIFEDKLEVSYGIASYGTQVISSSVITAYIAFGKLLAYVKENPFFEEYIKSYLKTRTSLRSSYYDTRRLIENPLSL